MVLAFAGDSTIKRFFAIVCFHPAAVQLSLRSCNISLKQIKNTLPLQFNTHQPSNGWHRRAIFYKTKIWYYYCQHVTDTSVLPAIKEEAGITVYQIKAITMKVVLVGSGNVATILGNVIHNAGHQIVQVLSRNENHAAQLAAVFGCGSGSFRTTPYQEADLYLLAITDTALYHLDQYVQLGNRLVVHTAGSVSREVLKNVSSRNGILYPLQSLVRNSGAIPPIPLLIDGCDEAVLKEISAFARTLSPEVSQADDQERLRYHVAAVLVNNFTNHMYAMADDFCRKENISFKNLYPLIIETTQRIRDHSPQSVQTGPAIREDIYTLGKHLAVLSAHPDLKYLYLKLSESILKLHQKK